MGTDEMKPPLISIVMSNWNGEIYLRSSIESMLRQTFRDFEYIILDDGSTDNSRNIITQYAKTDSRITPIFFETNRGLTHALNHGIGLARGKYIVRMDSDDISLPDRLEKQIEYMEKPEHAHVGVCGSFCEVIDKQGERVGLKKFPVTDEQIRKAIWYRNPLQHSTTIIRKTCFDTVGLYNPRFMQTEDFELWMRIGSKFHFHNLPEVLLQYRIHGKNIVVTKQKRMIYQVLKARRIAHRRYGYYMSSRAFLFYIITIASLFVPSRITLWIFNKIQIDD